MKRNRTSAFALLFTIVLLAFAGTVLAMVARQTYGQVERADQAQSELQRRWAAATLRPLVDQAEQTLATSYETTTSNPDGLSQPASHKIETKLGGLSILLTFADEQAKLPIHHVFTEQGLGETAHRLRTLLSAELAGRVRLRPIDAFVAKLNDLPAPPQTAPFYAFSQVVSGNLTTPNRLAGEDSYLVAEQVTLWGSGILNILHADEEVIAATLAPDLDLSQARQLKETTTDPATLEDAIRQLALSDRIRERVQTRLSTQSETYSLWITIRDDRRDYHEMIVRENGQAASMHRLSW